MRVNEQIKPEIELVERAKTDAQAFGELYDMYYPRVFNFCYRRCGNLESALDITSECFLGALKSISRFEVKHENSFSAWIFRIAVNCINQHYRKSSRIILSYDSEDFPLDAIPDAELESVESEFAKEFDFQKIQTAMQSLTPDEQTLIDLHYFEELKYAEVGTIMGIKEVTLRSKLSRTLEKLRNVLT